jgi:hypothetical protein
MLVAEDEDEVVGARSKTGFVPLSMRPDDQEQFRSYNWIDDLEVVGYH